MARAVGTACLPHLDAGRQDPDTTEEQCPPGVTRLKANNVGGGRTDSEIVRCSFRIVHRSLLVREAARVRRYLAVPSHEREQFFFDFQWERWIYLAC